MLLTNYSVVLIVQLESGLKTLEVSDQRHATPGAIRFCKSKSCVKLLQNFQILNLFLTMFLNLNCKLKQKRNNQPDMSQVKSGFGG